MSILSDFRVSHASFGAQAFKAPFSLWFAENEDCCAYLIRGKGAYFECPDSLNKPLYCTDNSVVLVTSGKAHGWRDAPTTEFGLPLAADAISLDPNVPLASESENDSEVVITKIRVPLRVFIRFLRVGPVIFIPKTAFEMNAKMRDIFDFLNDDVFAAVQEPISQRITETLTEIFLIEVTQYWMRYNATAEGADSSKTSQLDDPYLNRALEAIREAPEQNWTLDSMAREAGLRRSTFCMRFKQLMRVSPMQYLTTLRMSIAAARMREAEVGFAEIAWQVGYRSEAAFNRAFRREFNMTPGRYRRLYRASEQ